MAQICRRGSHPESSHRGYRQAEKGKPQYQTDVQSERRLRFQNEFYQNRELPGVKETREAGCEGKHPAITKIRGRASPQAWNVHSPTR
ncbi:hypothetical protein PIB30_046281 [Stylosanthes scabra]|uniref:Uncharacterized protein n=1 Tax=Stylosanthes scabra TaxID=79078 RepID=A0ABU6ZF67_9FABA|nr:hypothetical protein [Stylosanthes scabra]